MKGVTMANATAMAKAAEILFAKEVRLYEDPFSYQLISLPYKIILNIMRPKPILNFFVKLREKSTPGVYGAIISRTRYIDDLIEKAIEEGFEAIVNLGGGFDTRCIRVPGIDRLTYYHIDQSDVIEAYEKRIKKLRSGKPKNLILIDIDFEKQNLKNRLQESGYDATQKTLFLWEGVTQYIKRDATMDTLKFLSSTGRGNRVVFTYLSKEILDAPERYPQYKNIFKQMNMLGVSELSGFTDEEIERMLLEYGMTLIETADGALLEEKYLKPLGRNLSVMLIEKTVVAQID